jgi:hypothetical protein
MVSPPLNSKKRGKGKEKKFDESTMMRAPSNKSTLYEPSTFEIISALYRFHEPGNVPSRYSRLDDMMQLVNSNPGKNYQDLALLQS